MQYDVFPDMGMWRHAAEDGAGIREASVLRYKEKRRTRLFSKKIRYEVRKVNADKRPRMKVRTETLRIPLWARRHASMDGNLARGRTQVCAHQTQPESTELRRCCASGAS